MYYQYGISNIYYHPKLFSNPDVRLQQGSNLQFVIIGSLKMNNLQERVRFQIYSV